MRGMREEEAFNQAAVLCPRHGRQGDTIGRRAVRTVLQVGKEKGMLKKKAKETMPSWSVMDVKEIDFLPERAEADAYEGLAYYEDEYAPSFIARFAYRVFRCWILARHDWKESKRNYDQICENCGITRK